jgi:antitoxin component of RelBE/YafQ-DinJ toxin-antitoxin module
MKTIINIKADRAVKEQAQEVAHELGVPLSTVINAYLKEFIRGRQVYLSASPRMAPALESILGRVEADLKTGRSLSPKFTSAKAMDDYLDEV